MTEASGTCAQLVARVLGTSAEKLRWQLHRWVSR